MKTRSMVIASAAAVRCRRRMFSIGNGAAKLPVDKLLVAARHVPAIDPVDLTTPRWTACSPLRA